jgi:hypothetical protein
LTFLNQPPVVGIIVAHHAEVASPRIVRNMLEVETATRTLKASNAECGSARRTASSLILTPPTATSYVAGLFDVGSGQLPTRRRLKG